MVRWGAWGGAVLGVVVLALHQVIPAAFTQDPAVRSALAAALVVVAVGQPLSGYVFVVDGVLIGAGDGRWLAKAMVATLLLYLPLALGVHAVAGALLGDGGAEGQALALAALWVAFTAFMAIRGVLLWRRVRTDDWAVTGAAR
jgi:Na+-driven multidrug efflux pump